MREERAWDARRLRETLRRIDGRGYGAYRDCEGSYDFGDLVLHLDHAQADPFAAPSAVRVTVPAAVAGLPPESWSGGARRRGLEDYLLRRLAARAAAAGRGARGSGKSGVIAVYRPGQEMLRRSAVVVHRGEVEARFGVGLPAAGRTVLGREAEELLCEAVPALAREALVHRGGWAGELRRWCELAEDQEFLRGRLAEMGLVAFVREGAILPRRSGASDLPLPAERARPFASPARLRVQVHLPNGGPVTGMGVPAGVTVITGGGYHGKSTLLRTLERGVYDHVPGDGRELCVTVPGAVKIRAEDGRRVEKVDISAFITNLPDGQDTARFSTDNASGSTSQAANIVEALELGATCLLLDEDTSATNFMIRDARMQALVARDREPITPFVDRVRELHRSLGVSSVIVVGGSGDYLDVADTVIMMDAYEPRDVTERAREVAASLPTGRKPEAPRALAAPRPRVPLPAGFDAWAGRKEKVRARGQEEIQFGREEIDLSAVEQLVETGQTRAIAALLRLAARRHMDGRRSLREALGAALAEVEERGLDVLSPFPGRPAGDLALPRLLEVGAAANRLRTLVVR